MPVIDPNCPADPREPPAQSDDDILSKHVSFGRNMCTHPNLQFYEDVSTHTDIYIYITIHITTHTVYMHT